LSEAWVVPHDAYDMLLNALVDVQENEWKDNETTDRLLLENIDRQCRRYAEVIRRPYLGLRKKRSQLPVSSSGSGERYGQRSA